MRALITGANGFVGPHLKRHLEACGDDVLAIDRVSGDPDILDGSALAVCFETAGADVVYHLAGFSDVAASWTDPVGALRANAEGTLNVIEAGRASGVRRVLIVSSSDVYGSAPPEDMPLKETAQLRPTSPYAASKAAAERVGEAAFHGRGTEVIIVRAFNHLGPGQSPRFVAPALAARIAANEIDGSDEVRIGNLEAKRDFSDVRDVVRGYRLLIERGTPGEIYNLCRGEAVAVADIAAELLTRSTSSMRLVPDPDLMRPVEIPILVGDRTKMTTATGWEPIISLDQTLDDLLADQRLRARKEKAS